MDEPRRIWIGGRIDIMAEDRWVLWNLGAGLRGVQKVEREVMPVAEHQRAVTHAEQNREAAEDERDDMRQRVYGLAQTIRGMCTDEEPYPLIDAKLAELCEIVNPQEDER